MGHKGPVSFIGLGVSGLTGPEPSYQSNLILLGHVVVQWLRHCTTNRKVAGSIPDGVIGIFH
jgi:hypothetical protein